MKYEYRVLYKKHLAGGEYAAWIFESPSQTPVFTQGQFYQIRYITKDAVLNERDFLNIVHLGQNKWYRFQLPNIPIPDYNGYGSGVARFMMVHANCIEIVEGHQ